MKLEILKEIIKKLNKNEQNKFLHVVTKTDIRKQYKSEYLSKEDLKILNSRVAEITKNST